MVTRAEPAERLGIPALARLVDALAARYAQGDDPASVTLRDLDPEGQQALADLLGEARTRGPGARLGVARVAAALGLSDPAALRGVVEQLRGPLGNRRAERAAAAAAHAAVWDGFEVLVARLALPWAAAARETWLLRLQAYGPRGGEARHRRRLEGVVAVLRRLPADGIALPVLAQEALGDPHGLDPGRTVRAFVLDALAAAGFAPAAHDAESARALWEAAGVAPDPLSSGVLALGLAPPGGDPLATFLRASAGADEPAAITLAQLRRWPVAALRAGTPVFVVENPSLLVEAARDGAAGAIVVCSSGRPTVAVVTLLRQLTAAGAVARQHADFDHQGLAITAWLHERTGTRPWLMGADDYRRAVQAVAHDGIPLTLPLPPTPWDPALQQVMADVGVALHEEAVSSALLATVRATAAR